MTLPVLDAGVLGGVTDEAPGGVVAPARDHGRVSTTTTVINAINIPQLFEIKRVFLTIFSQILVTPELPTYFLTLIIC
jgi:hypothetical protein